MPRSSRFWLALLVYGAAMLVVLGIPIDLFGENASAPGLLLILIGAVASLLLRGRDPVLSRALRWGFLIAVVLMLGWFVAHFRYTPI